MSFLSKRASFWLRLIVSLALIGFMVSRLDVSNMGRFVARADVGLVLLTLLAVFIDRAIMAVRWIVLVEALDLDVPRWRVVKIFFLSTFFGSFLPSGVGGIAVRAYSFAKLTSKAVESVASIAMDRFLGFASMLLTGLLSLSVFYRVYPHPVLLVTVILLSAGLALALGLALSRRMHALVLEKHRYFWITKAVEALARYRERVLVLAFVLLLSVGVQLLRVLQAFLLSESMDLGTPGIYFLCFIPLILMVTMLPISISGWGTANVAYVALFSQVGMDPDGAFVLSALILGLGVVGNLPGGIIYALEGFGATREETSAST